MMRCWHSYLSGRGADLHMAKLMPLPLPLPLTISCSRKFSRLVSTFLVPAHPDSPSSSSFHINLMRLFTESLSYFTLLTRYFKLIFCLLYTLDFLLTPGFFIFLPCADLPISISAAAANQCRILHLFHILHS